MKKILLLTVISLTLFSCDKNNTDDLDAGEMVTVSFSLTVDGSLEVDTSVKPLGNSSLTKSTYKGENMIKHLWVLQFDTNAANAKLKSISEVQLDGEGIAVEDYDSESTNQNGTLAGEINLYVGDNNQFRVVANSTAELFKDVVVADYTLNDFTEDSIIFSALEVLEGYQPMIGAADVSVKNNTIKIAKPFQMTRLFSKVTFKYDVATNMTNFKVKKIFLCNIPDNIPLMVKTHEFNVTRDNPGSITRSKLLRTIDDADTEGGKSGELVFYTPQNRGGVYARNAAVQVKDGKDAGGGQVDNREPIPNLTYILLEAHDDTRALYYKYYIGAFTNAWDDYTLLSNDYYKVTSTFSDTGEGSHPNVSLTPPVEF